ncbi:hypothetical protein PINS_up007815 [Pythium insidiosum]|nr:hypothetical protein PINS_up007815 [Pythium insidiosum]
MMRRVPSAEVERRRRRTFVLAAAVAVLALFGLRTAMDRVVEPWTPVTVLHANSEPNLSRVRAVLNTRQNDSIASQPIDASSSGSSDRSAIDNMATLLPTTAPSTPTSSLPLASNATIQNSSTPSLDAEVAVPTSNASAPAVHPEMAPPRPPSENEEIHIVFSAGCDQDQRVLQQSILQISATAVGQRGPITQIIAGCTDEQRARVLQEPTFYYDFRRHFTPNFYPHPEPNVTDDYKPYNKPFALRHFLQHAESPITSKYIAIIDGDFAFFHPLEINTGRNVSALYRGSRDPATVSDTVRDGWAVSMTWAPWQELKFFTQPEMIAGMCGNGTDAQPCGKIPEAEAMEYYGETASPYILTVNDLRKMIDDYCHFTVVARSLLKSWIVEMEAYSFAAANHGIRHTKLLNYGISLPSWRGYDEEYWWFVNEFEPHVNPCIATEDVALPGPQSAPLYFFHYFHTYTWGEKYKINKRDLPRDVMTNCSSPLLRLPPEDAWAAVGSNQHERRHIWAYCSLIKRVNQALVYHRARTCVDGFDTIPAFNMTPAPPKL